MAGTPHALGRLPRRQAVGHAFIGPALLTFAAFIIYPLVYSLWLSFREWDDYTPEWGPFVRLANRAVLADTEVFWKALVTIAIVLFQGQFIAGLTAGAVKQ